MIALRAILYNVLILLSLVTLSVAVEYCDDGTGQCKKLTPTDCPFAFYNQHMVNFNYCDELNDIVCCPIPKSAQPKRIVDNTHRFEKACQMYNEARPSCQSTPFIINGTKAAPREYPFMALIGTWNRGSLNIKWDCGGTIIHPKYVVTAAHCLETVETKDQRLDPNFESPKFIVRLGELDYNSTSDEAHPEDFGVVNYIVHPAYNDDDEESHQNDIALIELDRNATFSEYVAPACLPSSSGNEHLQLTAAGWGLTRDAGEPSTHLLRVTLERFSDEMCAKRVEQKIDIRIQFCTGSSTSDADTCNGDSGGPIFVQHPLYGCLKQLIGITSYGLVCGRKNFPSVYTKVYLYTDWIEKIVWGV